MVFDPRADHGNPRICIYFQKVCRGRRCTRGCISLGVRMEPGKLRDASLLSQPPAEKHKSSPGRIQPGTGR